MNSLQNNDSDFNFKVGDKVVIVCEECGHDFSIGEEVSIVEVNDANEDYQATNGKISWWVRSDEIKKA